MREDWINALCRSRPEHDVRYFEALVDKLSKEASGDLENTGFDAIDTDLRDKSGYVFLWSDILDAEEIVESLIGSQLTASQLATLAFQLVTSWKRLRKVRIRLTPDQFIVLRAIRNGIDTIESLSKETEIEELILKKCISELKELTYDQSVKVVQETNGRLSTPF